MSIQAGWNNMLGHLAVARGIGKLNKNIKNIGADETLRKAQLETRNKQAENPNFVGPLTMDQELRRRDARGTSEALDNAFQDAAPGLGTPAYEEMMSEQFSTPMMAEVQMAEQQAMEAAQVADRQPQNHGYMAGIEQQVESALAADTDPMAELRRMTNEAMDEMDRRANNMGGND